MTDKNQVKNAILRKSFSSFVQKCFYELNPSETFIKGAYIDLLCDQIQRGKKSETDNQSSSKIFKIGYMFYSFARVYFGA